jgi:uncharacterized membrane protein
LASESQIEDRISRLLWYGVMASGALALCGMALYLANPAGSGAYSLGSAAIMAGVALLLVTPAARVAMLFFHYIRLKDYDFVLITLFVLLMMALGYLSGAG